MGGVFIILGTYAGMFYHILIFGQLVRDLRLN